MNNIRIGDVLKEKGFITEEQMMQALAYQKEHSGVRIGEALQTLGFVTERQVLVALAERLGYDMLDLTQARVQVDAVGLVPKQLASKYGILPVAVNGNDLQIVTYDPMNFYGIEDIRQVTGKSLTISLAEKADIERNIEYFYSDVSAHEAAMAANRSFEAVPETLEVDEEDSDAPIINLLNSLVQRGYAANASDIHVEPFEQMTQVRMRVDGVLINSVTLQKEVHPSLIARIKIVSGLDIAEKRVPQDGHYKTRIAGENVNIRVSVIPTVYGEKAVLRLLSGHANIEHAGSFGMEEYNYKKFVHMLQSPNGIVYITGPTGSGKTTTLYMALENVVNQPVNISTIEDPVEKNIPGISQVQVNNVAGLTFEAGLRSLLRQDPDIIMVGETRDAETASISARAALTGHLVFSTLHTNSAVGSIVRLVDMGLEPYMIANSLVGIVAQRLMRRVCPDCAVKRPTTEIEREMLGEDVLEVMEPKGCSRCNHTGFRGRIAIHEILEIDKQIRSMITDGSTMEEITAYAVASQNMQSLKDEGVKLVKEGITSMSELMKVAYYTD